MEQAALEIRDDQGPLLTDRLFWGEVNAWRPSPTGTDLIDLELEGGCFTPVPEHLRPLWERRFTGPPDIPNTWTDLDSRHRVAWLDLVRGRARRRVHRDRRPVTATNSTAATSPTNRLVADMLIVNRAEPLDL